MNSKISSSPGRAATLGAAAAFGVSIVGGTLGSWIESQWNMTVVSWEMAALVVCVMVTLGGFLVGSLAAMTRRIVAGTILGAVVLGACLAGVGLTNGSPQGVAIWTISVGICAGSASGAVGGAIGRRSARS